MEELIKKYEIIQSKTGKWIPLINDIHLHSTFDPEKEADALIERHAKSIKEKKFFLVLGLGFAYHIFSLAKKLQINHGDDYEIMVIEPSSETVSRFFEINKGIKLDPHIKIYQNEDPEEIYEEVDVVKFLCKKPGVISHPASFNFYSKFFKDYLTYIAPSTVENIKKSVHNKTLETYLDNFDRKKNLRDIFWELKKIKPVLDNDLDYFLLAYEKLTKNNENISTQGIVR